MPESIITKLGQIKMAPTEILIVRGEEILSRHEITEEMKIGIIEGKTLRFEIKIREG